MISMRKFPPGGYAWWYVDGISDDGKNVISIIGFVGGVFSPWYQWAGRKEPENHCCTNVVTYGRGGRFAMTDCRSGSLYRQADILKLGSSSMVWDGRNLMIELDEVSSWPVTFQAFKHVGRNAFHPANKQFKKAEQITSPAVMDTYSNCSETRLGT